MPGMHTSATCAIDLPALRSCTTFDDVCELLETHHGPLTVWELDPTTVEEITQRQRKAFGPFFKSQIPVHHRDLSMYDFRFVDRLDEPGEVAVQLDEFLKVREETAAVVIGPSGCGKSFELVDFARHHFCIFIDCTISEYALGDINYRDLESDVRRHLVEVARDGKQDAARDICQIDVIARYAAFHHARRLIPNLTPEQWLNIQLSPRGQALIQELVGWFRHMNLEQRNSIALGASEAIPLVIDEAGVMRSCLKEDLVSRAVSGGQQRVVEEKYHRGLLGAYAEGFIRCFDRSKIIMAGTDIHLGDTEVLFSDHEKSGVRPVKITGFAAWPASRMRRFLERHLDLSGVNTGILQKRILRGRPRWCERIIRDLPSFLKDAHSKQSAFDTAVEQLAGRLVSDSETKRRIEMAYNSNSALVSSVIKSSILSDQSWTESDAEAAAVLAERVCYLRKPTLYNSQLYGLRINEVTLVC